MMIVRKCIFALLALLLMPQGSNAQYDVNGNGTVDVLFTLAEGTQLRWYGKDLTTDEVVDLGLFGHPDYQVHIGYWSVPHILTRVFISKNEFGGFELHAENRNAGYQLGQSNQDALVSIGRDIDSSGLLDAVLINGARSKWAWKFSFDPLSETSSKRRILFGKKRFIPFLFRARGSTDSLGLLNVRGARSKISYRPIRGRRKRAIRLREFIPRQGTQPLVVREDNGRDSFGFIQDQKLITINRRGRKKTVETDIPKNGSILIGDFNSNGYDEIVTFANGELLFSNGKTTQLNDVVAQPMTSTSGKNYEGDEISPIITATPANPILIAPTNTVAPTPTIQLTYTPFPTVTPVFTGTPTRAPTATLTYTRTGTATSTSTPTDTYTPIPTHTPQFTYTPVPPAATYTPYPTFTATFTPTATDTPTPIPTPVITGTPPAHSAIRTDCNAHRSAGETTDGVYWVDPDGDATGVDPMRAYCDMTTDGGGWTLVMNYLHQAATDPDVERRLTSLPLLNSTTLGVDESGTEYWGHAIQLLLVKFTFSDIRFYCQDDEGWLAHFKTDDSNCRSYITTGFENCQNVSSSYVILDNVNHNTTYPADTLSSIGGQQFDALTQNILKSSGSGGNPIWWKVKVVNDWACGNQRIDGSHDTHHQVWIR